MNVNAFRSLSYGVYVISTWDEGRPTGCTANSAMQITSEPATIAISINHTNYTNECISRTGKFAISILGEHSAPSIIGTFGFQSGRDADKFADVDYAVKGYMPVVTDACAYIVCEVINKMETDTHTVFLGKVTDCDVLKNDDAMTYAYYHKVIKGKSPKAAPTYLPDETEGAAAGAGQTATAGNGQAGTASNGQTGTAGAGQTGAEIKAAEAAGPGAVYVCSICGYVYDGETPFEELPDDYRCPICGHPKSDFVKKTI